MTRILEHVLEQHAENVAALWLLRDRAADAPHYDRKGLAGLDERLEANIDGLRVAGEAGWQIAMSQLARNKEQGELFTAGVLGLESGDFRRIDALIAIAESVPEARRGLLGSIGWVSVPQLRPIVGSWLGGGVPFARYLGVVACSHHRVDPGARLKSWLTDQSELIRARALRLAGELGRCDLAPMAISVNTDDTAQECQFWAAWTIGMFRQRLALSRLLSVAESECYVNDNALQIVARLFTPDEARTWISTLSGQLETQILAIKAAGLLGDPAVIPWLIEKMHDVALARRAAESLVLITGTDVVLTTSHANSRPDAPSGPKEQLSEEQTTPDKDDGLPWPDPALVAEWWRRNHDKLASGQRYLLGKPIGKEAWTYAWSEGCQRQRRAAAHEEAMALPITGLRAWKSRRYSS